MFIETLDDQILQAATQLGGTGTLRDQLVYAIANLLPFIIIPVGIGLFLSGRTPAARIRNQDTMIVVLGGAVLAVGARILIANAINRPRPFVADPSLHHVALPISTTSFPSGHAFLLFTVAGIIFFLGRHPWLGWLLLLMAAVVSVARVVAGVHYPSDVLGGAILGLLLAKLVAWQSHWIEGHFR
jgi:undecaprenyl-diphosphatase